MEVCQRKGRKPFEKMIRQLFLIQRNMAYTASLKVKYSGISTLFLTLQVGIWR